MKIESVESIVAGGAHFVRIRTEDGLAGMGQSACWAYPKATDQIVREAFAPYLVGQEAGRIEHHWQQLYRMGPFRGSILGGAVSAVDIALWDIKGQRHQAPIWELLGGRCRDRIRLHLLLDGGEDPDDVARAASAAAEDGFTAIKLDPLRTSHVDAALPRLVDDAVEIVAAARKAIGKDVDLIVELHRKLTPPQAVALAKALGPFSPLFIEDPIQIDSIVAQADLARHFSSAAALGERFHTIWEFRELLERAGPVFCRPDPGISGGITHTKKIAALAEAHHAIVVTHNFLGPLLTAASLHLDTCTPNFLVQEYSLVDEDPRIVSAFPGTPRREGGYLPVPGAVGLGVALNEQALEDVDVLAHQPVTPAPRADGSAPYPA